MTDWTQGLRDSPFARPEETQPPPRRPDAIDLYIGIDYGTRFTKVAIGSTRSRQVWQDSAGIRLFPSVVHVTPDGIALSYPEQPPPGSERIEYLKMLLADPDLQAFRSARAHLNGKPISEFVRPLAALFLSGLTRSVRAYLTQNLASLRQRPVNWFLNVGVPVAHCDSNAKTFKEVAAVAFHWSEHPPGRMRLDDLLSAYLATARSLDIANSPASVVPELAAALHEFVRDPNRADNLYGFFDIGGGTVDGAIFRINRSGEGSPLQIQATRVDSTGTMAITRTMIAELYLKMQQYIESQIIGPEESPRITIPLADPLSFRDDQSVTENIQSLVHTLIYRTSRKPVWGMFSPHSNPTITVMPPLRIFLSGGGASSKWYKKTIEDTYTARNLSQWSVTGIRTEVVAKPADYRQTDYPRFVVALGLADPSAGLVEALLPSQIEDAEPLPERRSAALITKDHV
jgi:hypothetical protein